MGFKFATLRLGWSKEVGLCILIVLSAVIAIPLSAVFDRNIAASGFQAGLALLLFPLLFVQDIKRILYVMIPACYLQAGMMAWQWFFQEGVFRAPGLAHNANAGSALLLLGAIFLATHPRLKWLAVPLLVAIPFSGSRWTLIIATLVFGLMFLARYVHWRYLLIGISVAFIALFSFQHDQIKSAFRVGNAAGVTQTTAATIRIGGTHSQERLTASTPVVTPKLLIPQGFVNSDLHNVPLRMAVETGLLSGVAWIAVGMLVLYRRPRYCYAWWMMLAVCLLSLMYYHTWVGPMGAFWWLLVSKLMLGSLESPKRAVRRSWGHLRGALTKGKAPVLGP